jgi:predicted nucleic acid-binding protein
MSGRFFLDTNIFVYSFDANSPKKAAQAKKLIRGAIETHGGIVTYQVVQEFFNLPFAVF